MKRTLASGKRHSAAPIDPIYKLLLLFPVVVAIAGAVVRNCSLPEWTTPKQKSSFFKFSAKFLIFLIRKVQRKREIELKFGNVFILKKSNLLTT